MPTRESRAEPEAAVTIVEEGAGGEGFKFTVTGEVLAGPQIVKILNASDQPHFVIAFHYPEEITIEQVMEFLMFDPSSGATPSAAMLDETLLTFPMYAPTQSVGTTQWVELDRSLVSSLLSASFPIQWRTAFRTPSKAWSASCRWRRARDKDGKSRTGPLWVASWMERAKSSSPVPSPRRLSSMDLLGQTWAYAAQNAGRVQQAMLVHLC